MKKIFCLFLILAVSASAFSQSISITGTAPTVQGNPGNINDELNSAFSNLKSELNSIFGSINAMPQNLIQAFGNAAVYASHGATQRGYGGYKNFAVTFGPSVGIQLPVSPFDMMDYITGDPLGKLYNDGDITFGISPQVINAQIGFKTSFLLKDLYFGLRVGYVPKELGNILGGLAGGFAGGLSLSFDNLLIGITANYQLVESVDIIKGLITWRGINIGSGFIFQNTRLSMAYPLEIDPVTSGRATLTVDPRLLFNMNITTFTVPVEIMTAINLLFINIPLGVGVDFANGLSDISIGMESGIDVAVTGVSGTINPGRLNVNAGGKGTPSFTNFKLMSGIGFKIGSLVLDIPITWYFLDNGVSFGVTLGLVW